MMNVQESTSIILAFKEHLIAGGKSDSTIKSYIGEIAAFVEFLGSKGVSFDFDIKRFYVTSYRKQLVERGYEVNTINKKINSLQSLNQFLIDQGKMTEQVVVPRKDKVKVAAGSEKEVEVFSEQETEHLLFHIQDHRRVNQRDRL